VISLSEPWSIIEFAVLFVAAVIIALKEYGEKLPSIVIEKVPAFFKSRHWAGLPLALIVVFVVLQISQSLGILPKDRSGIPSPPQVSTSASRSDQNTGQVAALQSELVAKTRELANVTRDLATTKRQLEAAEATRTTTNTTTSVPTTNATTNDGPLSWDRELARSMHEQTTYLECV
jgi:hypothetical protein